MKDQFRSKLRISGAIILTSSGRIALELALRVLRESNPERRKVIIPTYCCRGVFNPVVRARLLPVFVDMDGNLNISRDSARQHMSDDVLGIVVPHIGGCKADIDDIASSAKQHGVAVIEDTCQALGRKSSGRFTGTDYDMSIFSFTLGKNLMATAGGVLISNILKDNICKEATNLQQEDTSVVRKRFWAILLRYFFNIQTNIDDGLISSYQYNAMHPLDANLLLHQLGKLDEVVMLRRNNAQKIISSIQRARLDVRWPEDKYHIYTKLSLICRSSEECGRLRDFFYRQGIETESMYVPLHLRDFAVSNSRESLPNSEGEYKKVFNVPVRPNLRSRELDRIVRAIESYARQ